MKRFVYKAKEQSTGKIIKGTIQAETERIAGKLLVDRGYVPESLKEEGQGFGDKLNKVTAKDRINFTRQFATLVGAGLPIAQSLRTVSEQTQNKAMKPVVEEILAEIEAGHALGDAFAKHPEVFNNVYLSLVRAGEVSGTLDDSLKRIAMQEEKDAKGEIVRSERLNGAVSRSFYVGETLRDTDLHASYEDGVLKVTFPTAEKKEAETKKFINID